MKSLTDISGPVVRALMGLSLLAAASALSRAQYISKVWEYKPAPGQHINAAPLGLPHSTRSLIGGIDGALSLGAFGGYVIFSFNKAVENHPGNPYGVDFTIFGNPSMQWSEPGIVSVMVDENGNGLPDDTWYELAGSDKYFSSTLRGYEVRYENPGGTVAADVPWTDNQGNSGFVLANAAHKQPYYPATDSFPAVDPGSYSLSGTVIRDALDEANPGLVKSYLRDFGFADNRPRGSAPWTLPDNPYTREKENAGGDAFDIGWAMDSSGNYVELDSIHFVKVHTGVMADGGWLGEVSTEITGAAVVAPDASVSGVTEMVVIKDLPPVIDTSEFQLEAFAFDMGRWQPDEPIGWTPSEPWAAVGQDGILTVTQSGKLTLTAYLASRPGISTSATTTVDLSHVSSIRNNRNLKIRIFPNPAGDMIRIDGFGRARVSVYTVSGVRVLVRENHTGGEGIRLDGLPGGLYIVKITSGGDSVTAPMIKQ